MSRRTVTNGYADRPDAVVRAVVQIIPSVFSLHHIRCPQLVPAVRHAWILCLFIDHAFIAPICQIGDRSGIAHIIVGAKFFSIKGIMTAVDIDSVTEHMRFAVRDILI